MRSASNRVPSSDHRTLSELGDLLARVGTDAELADILFIAATASSHAYAGLGHGSEKCEGEPISQTKLSQPMVEVEEKLKAGAASYSAAVFRVASEANGDAAVPPRDQIIQPFLQLEAFERWSAD